METSNFYEERSRKQKLQSILDETNKNKKQQTSENKTGQAMDVLKNTGMDALISVLGGGLGAAALGRMSFVAGLALTSFGHYKKNDHLRVLGIGLMTSSSMALAQGVKQDPNASASERMLERVKAFGQELKHKLFLDKLKEQKPTVKNETKQPTDLKGTPPVNKYDSRSSQTSTQQQTTKTQNDQKPNPEPKNPSANQLRENEAEDIIPPKYKDWSNDFISIADKLY
jgi:hypothetical protein